MEILYTWSWPLPKDTPALQEESLLSALCSTDGCMGGMEGTEGRSQEPFDRQQDMAKSTCLSSAHVVSEVGAGKPQVIPCAQKAFFQDIWTRRIPSFQVQKQRDSSLPRLSCTEVQTKTEKPQQPTSPNCTRCDKPKSKTEVVSGGFLPSEHPRQFHNACGCFETACIALAFHPGCGGQTRGGSCFY